MNLIVENSPAIQWYTCLFPFLSRLGPIVDRYLWLLTNIEINSGLLPFHEDPPEAYWVTGLDLLRFVEEVRPQFIWGVLSAITHNNEQMAKRQECYPFADGNRAFWVGTPRPQHPFAEFEVVCWDSSLTLLIGANDEVAECFRNAYPGTVDLDVENAKRRS